VCICPVVAETLSCTPNNRSRMRTWAGLGNLITADRSVMHLEDTGEDWSALVVLAAVFCACKVTSLQGPIQRNVLPKHAMLSRVCDVYHWVRYASFICKQECSSVSSSMHIPICTPVKVCRSPSPESSVHRRRHAHALL
jgi:hypothetical protein